MSGTERKAKMKLRNFYSTIVHVVKSELNKLLCAQQQQQKQKTPVGLLHVDWFGFGRFICILVCLTLVA